MYPAALEADNNDLNCLLFPKSAEIRMFASITKCMVLGFFVITSIGSAEFWAKCGFRKAHRLPARLAWRERRFLLVGLGLLDA